jgi:predicted CXXCH cytochrome family protein
MVLVPSFFMEAIMMHRKKSISGWATLILLIMVMSLAFTSLIAVTAEAAIPTAKIQLRAVSPRDMAADTTLKRASTGLPNVAVGSLVYLLGGGGLADTVTTYAWTLTPPTGSSATLSNAAIQNPTFLADVAGQYLVGLVITDKKGQVSAQTSLWINAGTYVGVGNIGGKTPTFPQCAWVCHPQQESKWHHTRHAEIFRDGIDGKLPSTYRSTCISCHTTGYDTNPAAANGGFDDVAKTVGWVFPTTLQQGNWDTLVTKYPKLAQLGVIGCESCHGPGSAHGGLHDKNQIHATYDIGPCAVCHDSGTRHFRPYQWDMSAHAISSGIATNPEYMNRVECAKCHTAQGFVEETIKGKASAAPYANVKPITCAACHDPHDATAPQQLRRGSVAEACTGCHVLRISSRGLHSSHQTDMLEGKSGGEYPGQVYLNSTHSEIEDKCAVCHMARTAEEPITAADSLVGGHTFKVYNDRGTVDLSDDVVNKWGCIECHGEVSPAFVHLSQEGIKALLDSLKTLLPKDATGTPIVHVRLDPKLYTKAEIAGAYNYYFVLNDGSYGVHNHRYAEKLLRDAIKEIKVTAGAGNIVDIFDVPNDQGKQVHILWNTFPAEQSAINPIINYGVWRRDDGGSTNGMVVRVGSFKDMLTKANIASTNSQFVVAGSEVWTFVGLVPAAGHDRYGYVAPSLFDSTKVDGMHWSVFYISGHTSDPTIVYESVPDSGYSVDNLVPAAPGNVSASIVTSTVRLQWDDPVDADFKYFAIYRGTTSGFDPKGTKPIATLITMEYTDSDVVLGTAYYYRLSAFDFSGNESPFSPELMALVTRVEERGSGIPTVYALEQNYPNPFNPETTIKYQLPTTGRVRITIYNALGHEVRQLIDRVQPAAYHVVVWDGRDNAGNPMPSGVYFYRLESGKFTAMKKMVMMK